MREYDVTSTNNWDVFKGNDKLEEFSREKHTSKTKKVKNYLKKCKNTANSFIQSKAESNAELELNFKQRKAVEDSVPLTSWYVTDEFYVEEEPKNHVTVVQITDAAKNSIQVMEYNDFASVHSTRVELEEKFIGDICGNINSHNKGNNSIYETSTIEEKTELFENFIRNFSSVDKTYGKNQPVSFCNFYYYLI